MLSLIECISRLVSGSCAGYFRSAIFLQFPSSSDLHESFIDFLEGCSSEGYPTVPEHCTLHEDLIRNFVR